MSENQPAQTAVATPTVPRLFVDMDGTLAEFKAVDTLETLYRPNYFANLAPNKNVVEAVRDILKDHPEIEVFILSAVLSDSAHAQIEKNQWLDEQLPEIASSHRIFMPCGQDKKAYIPGGVQPTDYLLDDYTHNLTLWEPPARGIKLMNGINGTHGTWQGYRVDYLLEPDALAKAVLNHMVKSTTFEHTAQVSSKMEERLERSNEYNRMMVEDLNSGQNELEPGELTIATPNHVRGYSVDQKQVTLKTIHEIEQPENSFTITVSQVDFDNRCTVYLGTRELCIRGSEHGVHFPTMTGDEVSQWVNAHVDEATLTLRSPEPTTESIVPNQQAVKLKMPRAETVRDRGGNGQVIQAIKEHFDILRYAEEQYGLHFKESSRGWMQCVEYDSMYIDPVAQTFVRHSRGISGDVVNMVAHLDNLSLNDAISRLRQEIGTDLTPRKRNDYDTLRQKQEAMKSFVLPKKLEGKYSKLFGYLVNRRCIEPKVVSDMVKGKLLYESAEHHNCVFVGMDYDGKAKSATLRSTGDIKFQGEVPGSEKLGWIVNPNKAILFIGEAPIDMLSVMSLLERGGKDYHNFTFLAQGGNPRPGMLAHHIQNNPKVTMVYLCHDNDAAGQALADKALLELQNCGFTGDVKRKLPTGKDFNDDLKQLLCAKAPAQEQTAETQQEVTPCFSQE